MFARKRMRVRVLVFVCARAGAVCLCARNIRSVCAQLFVRASAFWAPRSASSRGSFRGPVLSS